MSDWKPPTAEDVLAMAQAALSGRISRDTAEQARSLLEADPDALRAYLGDRISVGQYRDEALHLERERDEARAEAERYRAALEPLANPAVEFEDPRLEWITIQVLRSAVDDARAALAQPEGPSDE